jgi:hypothetical protein
VIRLLVDANLDGHEALLDTRLRIDAWRDLRDYLIHDTLEVYRQPQPDGTYKRVQILQRGQHVDVAMLAGINLTVAEML